MRFKIVAGSTSSANVGRTFHATHAREPIVQLKTGEVRIFGFTHAHQEVDQMMRWPGDLEPADAEAREAVEALNPKRARAWADRFVESERQRKEHLVHERSERQRKAREKLRLEAAAPKMLEALQLIAGTDPLDAALDPQRAVRVARAAVEEAIAGEEEEST